MVMMYVPEGEFLMGSDTGEPDQQPVHAVYLDAFWIDRTEVTNAMFARFLTEMGNQREGDETCVSCESTWFIPVGADESSVPGPSTWQPKSGYEDHPMDRANWFAARAYCAWADGGRLPTEAEWEKAARGGLEGRLYSWGDEAPTCTLGASNGAQLFRCGDTVPVGSFAPNGYGLYDMTGSVSEWVADWDSDTYYASSPYRNPLGPRITHGTNAVVERGDVGPLLILDMVRIAYRNEARPTAHRVGFRCVRSP
jgi:formylglycine-generating enzyme required for sulfatase activity